MIRAEGTPSGKKWLRLGQRRFRRGFKPLTLRIPEGADFDFICVSPNERYITHGRAEHWIRDRSRGKNVRCGLPLGGIGAGKVEISRDGLLRNITINNNIDTPFFTIPNSASSPPR